ncbi:MAG TPA: NAD-dependent epimerase/dehydratase family protein, partial [Methylomirabilota bacterium]|nr:NAD-dependent epimerase/dehydratase family protein [Methylomirabilota bacterium]
AAWRPCCVTRPASREPIMARRPVVLVTGASGEMGHSLIHRLAGAGGVDVLALDVRPLAPEVADRCAASRVGDVLDRALLERLTSEFEISAVFHLAALLSTRSEFVPETAHEVNVQGTLNLLRLALDEARSLGQPVTFLFPSSIAVYGLPDLPTKRAAGRVAEREWTAPITMYGCNKLYCEHLGRYFARHYRQLARQREPSGVDFRAIRFPGLISAFTLPSGGTSDYAPEMIHAAARDRPYACFVRADTRIPLMAMPDAIEALLALEQAPAGGLTDLAYNVSGFSPSAGELAEMVRGAFPGAQITFAPDARRQAIVDSWPQDVDDTRARRDWGFHPAYDLDRTFNAYLLPNITHRYAAR